MWERQLGPRNRGMGRISPGRLPGGGKCGRKEETLLISENIEGKLLGSLKGASKAKRKALFKSVTIEKRKWTQLY